VGLRIRRKVICTHTSYSGSLGLDSWFAEYLFLQLFFSFSDVLQANSQVAPKTGEDFLISNFRLFLNVVFFLGDSPASVPSS
jgi:hypothetical protein